MTDPIDGPEGGSTTPSGLQNAGFDASLGNVFVGVGVSGAALAATAWMVVGARGAFSVAVGGALSAANLWLLARVVGAMLRAGSEAPDTPESAEKKAPARAWFLLAPIKTFGFFGLAWALMRYQWVSPLAMLVGFGSLPLGIAFGPLLGHRASPNENQT